MKSMTEVKKILGRGVAAMALAAAVSAVPTKAAVIAGGSVPLDNYFVARGTEGIDVRAANGALATGVLATIYLNNNAPNSFSLTVTLAFGGFHRLGTAAAVPVIATGDGNPFLTADIVHTATALATEAKGFTAVDLAATAIVLGAVNATTAAPYAPGAATTASVDYGVDVRATWGAAAGLLAGYYMETISVSLVAVM